MEQAAAGGQKTADQGVDGTRKKDGAGSKRRGYKPRKNHKSGAEDKLENPVVEKVGNQDACKNVKHTVPSSNHEKGGMGKEKSRDRPKQDKKERPPRASGETTRDDGASAPPASSEGNSNPQPAAPPKGAKKEKGKRWENKREKRKKEKEEQEKGPTAGSIKIMARPESAAKSPVKSPKGISASKRNTLDVEDILNDIVGHVASSMTDFVLESPARDDGVRMSFSAAERLPPATPAAKVPAPPGHPMPGVFSPPENLNPEGAATPGGLPETRLTKHPTEKDELYPHFNPRIVRSCRLASRKFHRKSIRRGIEELQETLEDMSDKLYTNYESTMDQLMYRAFDGIKLMVANSKSFVTKTGQPGIQDPLIVLLENAMKHPYANKNQKHAAKDWKDVILKQQEVSTYVEPQEDDEKTPQRPEKDNKDRDENEERKDPFQHVAPPDPPSESTLLRINMEATQTYGKLALTDDSEKKRDETINWLSGLFSKKFGETVELLRFGGSGNGFGTCHSDIDLCMKISGMDDDERRDIVLREMGNLVRAERMSNVKVISTARVPIVKFTIPWIPIDVDICLNNPLAMENTYLLKHYTMIDPRVQQLGLIVKYWAKQRRINSPIHQTLSPYAYVLMTVYYLQTINPPILPSLQQFNDGIVEHRPVKEVSGRDVTYYRKVENLVGYGMGNPISLGELLAGFFYRYGYDMDYGTEVVDIKAGRRVPTDDRPGAKWRICIVDPFEPVDLGGKIGTHYSMNMIRKECRRAYDLMSQGGTLVEICTPYESKGSSNNRSGARGGGGRGGVSRRGRGGAPNRL